MQSNELNSIYNWVSVVGIGPKRWHVLLQSWEGAAVSSAEAWESVVKGKESFELPFSILQRVKKHHARFGITGWMEFLGGLGVTPIYKDESQYPVSLKQTITQPLVLYVKGLRSLLHVPGLAVVGTRHPTPSGVQLLRKILADFLNYSGKNVSINSGMMYGIDTSAHEVAMNLDSPTVAVLGGGLLWQEKNASNRVMADIIKSGGLVVSQFHPELPPQRGMFVARNAVLAGLSSGVLVGEAHWGSGSRHTVAAAKKYHKPIWTIPVRADHPAAVQVVELVNQHKAQLVIDAKPLKLFFGLDTIKSNRGLQSNTSEPGMSELLRALLKQGATFDHLLSKTHFSTSELNQFLARLELAGTIERRGVEWLLVDT